MRSREESIMCCRRHSTTPCTTAGGNDDVVERYDGVTLEGCLQVGAFKEDTEQQSHSTPAAVSNGNARWHGHSWICCNEHQEVDESRAEEPQQCTQIYKHIQQVQPDDLPSCTSATTSWTAASWACSLRAALFHYTTEKQRQPKGPSKGGCFLESRHDSTWPLFLCSMRGPAHYALDTCPRHCTHHDCQRMQKALERFKQLLGTAQTFLYVGPGRNSAEDLPWNVQNEENHNSKRLTDMATTNSSHGNCTPAAH
jgi:hypothetical protein